MRWNLFVLAVNFGAYFIPGNFMSGANMFAAGVMCCIVAGDIMERKA